MLTRDLAASIGGSAGGATLRFQMPKPAAVADFVSDLTKAELDDVPRLADAWLRDAKLWLAADRIDRTSTAAVIKRLNDFVVRLFGRNPSDDPTASTSRPQGTDAVTDRSAVDGNAVSAALSQAIADVDALDRQRMSGLKAVLRLANAFTTPHDARCVPPATLSTFAAVPGLFADDPELVYETLIAIWSGVARRNSESNPFRPVSSLPSTRLPPLLAPVVQQIAVGVPGALPLGDAITALASRDEAAVDALVRTAVGGGLSPVNDADYSNNNNNNNNNNVPSTSNTSSNDAVRDRLALALRVNLGDQPGAAARAQQAQWWLRVRVISLAMLSPSQLGLVMATQHGSELVAFNELAAQVLTVLGIDGDASSSSQPLKPQLEGLVADLLVAWEACDNAPNHVPARVCTPPWTLIARRLADPTAFAARERSTWSADLDRDRLLGAVVSHVSKLSGRARSQFLAQLVAVLRENPLLFTRPLLQAVYPDEGGRRGHGGGGAGADQTALDSGLVKGLLAVVRHGMWLARSDPCSPPMSPTAAARRGDGPSFPADAVAASAAPARHVDPNADDDVQLAASRANTNDQSLFAAATGVDADAVPLPPLEEVDLRALPPRFVVTICLALEQLGNIVNVSHHASVNPAQFLLPDRPLIACFNAIIDRDRTVPALYVAAVSFLTASVHHDVRDVVPGLDEAGLLDQLLSQLCVLSPATMTPLQLEDHATYSLFTPQILAAFAVHNCVAAKLQAALPRIAPALCSSIVLEDPQRTAVMIDRNRGPPGSALNNNGDAVEAAGDGTTTPPRPTRAALPLSPNSANAQKTQTAVLLDNVPVFARHMMELCDGVQGLSPSVLHWLQQSAASTLASLTELQGNLQSEEGVGNAMEWATAVRSSVLQPLLSIMAFVAGSAPASSNTAAGHHLGAELAGMGASPNHGFVSSMASSTDVGKAVGACTAALLEHGQTLEPSRILVNYLRAVEPTDFASVWAGFMDQAVALQQKSQTAAAAGGDAEDDDGARLVPPDHCGLSDRDIGLLQYLVQVANALEPRGTDRRRGGHAPSDALSQSRGRLFSVVLEIYFRLRVRASSEDALQPPAADNDGAADDAGRARPRTRTFVLADDGMLTNATGGGMGSPIGSTVMHVPNRDDAPRGRLQAFIRTVEESIGADPRDRDPRGSGVTSMMAMGRFGGGLIGGPDSSSLHAIQPLINDVARALSSDQANLSAQRLREVEAKLATFARLVNATTSLGSSFDENVIHHVCRSALTVMHLHRTGPEAGVLWNEASGQEPKPHHAGAPMMLRIVGHAYEIVRALLQSRGGGPGRQNMRSMIAKSLCEFFTSAPDWERVVERTDTQLGKVILDTLGAFLRDPRALESDDMRAPRAMMRPGSSRLRDRPMRMPSRMSHSPQEAMSQLVARGYDELNAMLALEETNFDVDEAHDYLVSRGTPRQEPPQLDGTSPLSGQRRASTAAGVDDASPTGNSSSVLERVDTNAPGLLRERVAEWSVKLINACQERGRRMSPEVFKASYRRDRNTPAEPTGNDLHRSATRLLHHVYATQHLVCEVTKELLQRFDDHPPTRSHLLVLLASLWNQRGQHVIRMYAARACGLVQYLSSVLETSVGQCVPTVLDQLTGNVLTFLSSLSLPVPAEPAHGASAMMGGRSLCDHYMQGFCWDGVRCSRSHAEKARYQTSLNMNEVTVLQTLAEFTTMRGFSAALTPSDRPSEEQLEKLALSAIAFAPGVTFVDAPALAEVGATSITELLRRIAADEDERPDSDDDDESAGAASEEARNDRKRRSEVLTKWLGCLEKLFAANSAAADAAARAVDVKTDLLLPLARRAGTIAGAPAFLAAFFDSDETTDHTVHAEMTRFVNSLAVEDKTKREFHVRVRPSRLRTAEACSSNPSARPAAADRTTTTRQSASPSFSGLSPIFEPSPDAPAGGATASPTAAEGGTAATPNSVGDEAHPFDHAPPTPNRPTADNSNAQPARSSSFQKVEEEAGSTEAKDGDKDERSVILVDLVEFLHALEPVRLRGPAAYAAAVQKHCRVYYVDPAEEWRIADASTSSPASSSRAAPTTASNNDVSRQRQRADLPGTVPPSDSPSVPNPWRSSVASVAMGGPASRSASYHAHTSQQRRRPQDPSPQYGQPGRDVVPFVAVAPLPAFRSWRGETRRLAEAVFAALVAGSLGDASAEAFAREPNTTDARKPSPAAILPVLAALSRHAAFSSMTLRAWTAPPGAVRPFGTVLNAAVAALPDSSDVPASRCVFRQAFATLMKNVASRLPSRAISVLAGAIREAVTDGDASYVGQLCRAIEMLKAGNRGGRVVHALASSGIAEPLARFLSLEPALVFAGQTNVPDVLPVLQDESKKRTLAPALLAVLNVLKLVWAPRDEHVAIEQDAASGTAADSQRDRQSREPTLAVTVTVAGNGTLTYEAQEEDVEEEGSDEGDDGDSTGSPGDDDEMQDADVDAAAEAFVAALHDEDAPGAEDIIGVEADGTPVDDHEDDAGIDIVDVDDDDGGDDHDDDGTPIALDVAQDATEMPPGWQADFDADFGEMDDDEDDDDDDDDEDDENPGVSLWAGGDDDGGDDELSSPTDVIRRLIEAQGRGEEPDVRTQLLAERMFALGAGGRRSTRNREQRPVPPGNMMSAFTSILEHAGAMFVTRNTQQPASSAAMPVSDTSMGSMHTPASRVHGRRGSGAPGGESGGGMFRVVDTRHTPRLSVAGSERAMPTQEQLDLGEALNPALLPGGGGYDHHDIPPRPVLVPPVPAGFPDPDEATDDDDDGDDLVPGAQADLARHVAALFGPPPPAAVEAAAPTATDVATVNQQIAQLFGNPPPPPPPTAAAPAASAATGSREEQPSVDSAPPAPHQLEDTLRPGDATAEAAAERAAAVRAVGDLPSNADTSSAATSSASSSASDEDAPAQPAAAAATAGVDADGPQPWSDAFDPAFLAELPSEIRVEILRENLHLITTPAPAAGQRVTEDSTINPLFLAVLPSDLQSEVVALLEQSRPAPPAAAAATDAAPAAPTAETASTSTGAAAAGGDAPSAPPATDAPPAAPRTPGDEVRELLSSLPADLREDILLTTDTADLAGAPELQEEARRLRRRRAGIPEEAVNPPAAPQAGGEGDAPQQRDGGIERLQVRHVPPPPPPGRGFGPPPVDAPHPFMMAMHDEDADDVGMGGFGPAHDEFLPYGSGRSHHLHRGGYGGGGYSPSDTMPPSRRHRRDVVGHPRAVPPPNLSTQVAHRPARLPFDLADVTTWILRAMTLSQEHSEAAGDVLRQLIRDPQSAASVVSAMAVFVCAPLTETTAAVLRVSATAAVRHSVQAGGKLPSARAARVFGVLEKLVKRSWFTAQVFMRTFEMSATAAPTPAGSPIDQAVPLPSTPLHALPRVMTFVPPALDAAMAPCEAAVFGNASADADDTVVDADAPKKQLPPLAALLNAAASCDASSFGPVADALAAVLKAVVHSFNMQQQVDTLPADGGRAPPVDPPTPDHRLEHPRHEHPLTWYDPCRTLPNYSGGGAVCNVCAMSTHWLIFHCGPCTFDLCQHCAGDAGDTVARARLRLHRYLLLLQHRTNFVEDCIRVLCKRTCPSALTQVLTTLLQATVATVNTVHQRETIDAFESGAFDSITRSLVDIAQRATNGISKAVGRLKSRGSLGVESGADGATRNLVSAHLEAMELDSDALPGQSYPLFVLQAQRRAPQPQVLRRLWHAITLYFTEMSNVLALLATNQRSGVMLPASATPLLVAFTSYHVLIEGDPESAANLAERSETEMLLGENNQIRSDTSDEALRAAQESLAEPVTNGNGNRGSGRRHFMGMEDPFLSHHEGRAPSANSRSVSPEAVFGAPPNATPQQAGAGRAAAHGSPAARLASDLAAVAGGVPAPQTAAAAGGDARQQQQQQQQQQQDERTPLLAPDGAPGHADGTPQLPRPAAAGASGAAGDERSLSAVLSSTPQTPQTGHAGASRFVDDREPLSGPLLRFAEANRSVINAMIFAEPNLLQGSLSFMTRAPRLIDFEFKYKDFRRKIDKKHSRAEQLSLTLNRDRTFQETFGQLRGRHPATFTGPVHIKFRGEDGADAGGLTREWLQLLADDISNTNYALFINSSEGMTLQPNPYSDVNPDHLAYFQFAGRMIGLAVRHEIPVDVHFTRSVYRHLVGVEPGLVDLQSIDPDMFKSMEEILRLDLDEVDLGLDFTITHDRFGEMQELELTPGGKDRPVTNENKKEYIRSRCRMVMTTMVHKQLVAFATGFYEIVPRSLVSVFTEHELELVISGMPDIDVEDLRVNTEYHGYSASSPQIRWFWEVVAGMSKQDKANLLQFATGASKVPPGGFSNLEGLSGKTKFGITRDDRDPTNLPIAHTCFNRIDLPPYPSVDIMREKLMIAITYGSKGFSLV